MITTDEQLSVNTHISSRSLKLAALQAGVVRRNQMALCTYPELFQLACVVRDKLLYKELGLKLKEKYQLAYCIRALRSEGTCADD